MGRFAKKRSSSALAREKGTIFKDAACRVALGYPATYGVAVSSLGAQHVYRTLNNVEGLSCERFFMPSRGLVPKPLLTAETGRPVGGLDALLFSVACERELLGLVQLLEASELRPLSKDRAETDAPVIIGGPLTYVDPRLVAPFADAVALGEADRSIEPIGEIVASFPLTKRRMMEELEKACPDLWVIGASFSPPKKRVTADSIRPAVAATWSPDAELSNLFLVEASRGCKQSCAFCTMSKKAAAAPCYRVFEAEDILGAIPDEAAGVGLVGAAVSEHPEIEHLVSALVDSGRRVSLSSLRADRLTPSLAGALRKGGLRTLTIAADGASERVRRSVKKGISQRHLSRAASVAIEVGFKQIRVYSMVGLPGEEDRDIDELADLLLSFPKPLGVTASVQAFVPKPGTPLGREKMADIALISHRLGYLKQRLRGRVRVQPTSPRWSWVDWRLAHAKERAAEIAIRAARDGGVFSAWKRAIERTLP